MAEIKITKIDEATEVWKQLLESGDVQGIGNLYHASGVLMGTLSQIRRDEPETILEYFENFASKEGIAVEFTDELLRDYGDVAINSGFYTFSWTENGKKIMVPARYSFVFMKEEDKDEWLILEHHSSLIPESPLNPEKYYSEDKA